MSGTFRRVLGACAIVASAAVIAVGCGSDSGGNDSNEPSGPLAKEQVFRINIGSDQGEGFDPPKTSYVESVNVVNQMFAGLYRVDDESSLVPFLATDLPEVSDDGLTYTVKLRDDAKWSDGKPLTAKDVQFGVQYALRNATAAYFAQYMLDIVGARKFNADKSPKADPSGIGVTAVDDHTIEFKLERKVPWFAGLLSLQTFYPLRQDVIEKYGDKWTEPGNIVVSGPFKLDSYTPKKEIILAKNDDWWDADKVKLDRIEMVVYEEAAAAVKAFDKKKIDTGFPRTMVPPEIIDRRKSSDEYRSTQTSSIQYAYFNTTSPKLKDPKVRQGIALAIDRELIVKTVTRRGDKPSGSIIPGAIPGYDVITEGSQDFIPTEGKPSLDKARSLLEEGGWKDGDKLAVYFSSESASAGAVVQAMKDSLEKVGVILDPQPTPGDALQQVGIGISPLEPKVEMLLQGWGADYLDAQNYYQLFTCANVENGLNSANYCNKDFDGIYEEALGTVDEDARFELYKQMESKLTGPEGDMPAAPLYAPTDDTLVQPWVKGFHLSPSSLLYFEGISIIDH